MTIEDLDPLKSEVSNLVELDFTAQSGNLGEQVGNFCEQQIPTFIFTTDLKNEIDFWFNNTDENNSTWTDAMKWLWKKIVAFFKWLFDL